MQIWEGWPDGMFVDAIRQAWKSRRSLPGPGNPPMGYAVGLLDVVPKIPSLNLHSSVQRSNKDLLALAGPERLRTQFHFVP